MINVYYT